VSNPFRSIDLKAYLDCASDPGHGWRCLDIALSFWYSEVFDLMRSWELRGVKKYYDDLAESIRRGDETEVRLTLELVAEAWSDIIVKPPTNFCTDDVMGFKRGYSWI